MERIAKQSKIIVVTGPESTGKTKICSELSIRLNARWIPELAREYVEALNQPYKYEDVIEIAKQQIAAFHKNSNSNEKITFYDTGLIITKVWLEEVYGKCPGFIENEIKNNPIDLHLLCDIDIPWVADSVRENGGENRKRLFHRYKTELENYGFRYEIISGLNDIRYHNAEKALIKHNII